MVLVIVLAFLDFKILHILVFMQESSFAHKS